MTPALEVLADPDDDVHIVQAIHQLARRERAVVVASIAPDSRTSAAVRWAILRSLGKRSEHLRGTPQWHQVARWLRAHSIAELILLRAQHLTQPVLDEIAGEIAARLSISVVLVHSGSDHPPEGPSIDIDTLIRRPRTHEPFRRRQEAWPTVPHGHPLRLRHDARAVLADSEFVEVQRLLEAAFSTLSMWLHRNPTAADSRVAAACEIVSIGIDENHSFIRTSGAHIALLAAGRRPPQRDTSRISTSSAIDPDVGPLLEYLDPKAAGFRLAQQITGLPDDLLGLIAADQISDSAILRRIVPDTALPILRALERGYEPALADLNSRERVAADELSTRTARHVDEASRILARLLETGRHAIRKADISHKTRLEFDQLCAQNVLTRYDGGAYHASDIALYGAFRRRAPIARTH